MTKEQMVMEYLESKQERRFREPMLTELAFYKDAIQVTEEGTQKDSIGVIRKLAYVHRIDPIEFMFWLYQRGEK